jgi:hypothetical protein
MDLYTRDGETVGPLPIKYLDASANERRNALHESYHTRTPAGR